MSRTLIVRSLAAFSVGAIVVGALAGCSQEAEKTPETSAASQDDLVTLAQAEGEVVWYNGVLPGTLAAVQKGFKDAYGIDVIAGERMSSAALGQRITADVRSNGVIAADLVSTTDNTLTDYLYSEGLTQAVVPDWFPDVDPVFLENESAVRCNLIVPVIGYNPDAIGDDFAVDSWDDLLDPALKGQIMINDPRGSAAWSQMYAIMLENDNLGEDYFTALAEQSYQPVASSLVGAEQLIAGQGGALLAGIPALFDPAIADGQSVAYWYPTNPSPISFNFCPLVHDSENPNAGKLFLQWLMTPDGQKAMTEGDSVASVFPDLPGAVVPQPKDWTAPPEQSQVEEDTETVLAILGFN